MKNPFKTATRLPVALFSFSEVRGFPSLLVPPQSLLVFCVYPNPKESGFLDHNSRNWHAAYRDGDGDDENRTRVHSPARASSVVHYDDERST